MEKNVVLGPSKVQVINLQQGSAFKTQFLDQFLRDRVDNSNDIIRQVEGERNVECSETSHRVTGIDRVLESNEKRTRKRKSEVKENSKQNERGKNDDRNTEIDDIHPAKKTKYELDDNRTWNNVKAGQEEAEDGRGEDETNDEPGAECHAIPASVKLQPVELPDPAVLIKTESSGSDYNIKTEPTDYYGLSQMASVKSEAVKEEPIEAIDMNDIEIVGGSMTSEDDICDEVETVVRCGECFQSFNSSAALTLHSKVHRGSKVEINLGQWLTEERCRAIAGSRFPEINVEPVSLENHDYVPRKREVSVPKMTTLQALESLLGSSKKPTSQHQTKITHQSSDKRIEDSRGEKPATSLQTTFTCQVCQKVNFGTMEAMRKHLSYHPHSQCLQKVNICFICDEKFDRRDPQYKVHTEKHLIEMRNSIMHQCLGCQALFKTKELLMTHVEKIHQNERQYPCIFCGKQYDRKDKLTRHLVIIHNQAIN